MFAETFQTLYVSDNTSSSGETCLTSLGAHMPAVYCHYSYHCSILRRPYIAENDYQEQPYLSGYSQGFWYWYEGVRLMTCLRKTIASINYI